MCTYWDLRRVNSRLSFYIYYTPARLCAPTCFIINMNSVQECGSVPAKTSYEIDFSRFSRESFILSYWRPTFVRSQIGQPHWWPNLVKKTQQPEYIGLQKEKWIRYSQASKGKSARKPTTYNCYESSRQIQCQSSCGAEAERTRQDEASQKLVQNNLLVKMELLRIRRRRRRPDSRIQTAARYQVARHHVVEVHNSGSTSMTKYMEMSINKLRSQI